MWFLRVDLSLKVFSHWEQEKDFFPVWINMCLLRFELYVKLFPQWEQLKDFIPAWINMWSLRFSYMWKCFHTESSWKAFWLLSFECCNSLIFLHWNHDLSDPDVSPPPHSDLVFLLSFSSGLKWNRHKDENQLVRLKNKRIKYLCTDEHCQNCPFSTQIHENV